MDANVTLTSFYSSDLHVPPAVAAHVAAAQRQSTAGIQPARQQQGAVTSWLCHYIIIP
jgi:hypothetical protein